MRTNAKKAKLRIAQSAYDEICKTVGAAKAEQGGLAWGYSSDMIIREYVHDPISGTAGTYTINAEYFNPIIKKKDENGLEVIAIIHSHPPSFRKPSREDIRIFNKYRTLWGFNTLLTPIIISSVDSEEFELLPFVFEKKHAPHHTLLNGIEIIPDTDIPAIKPFACKTEIADFSRIEDAVDMPLIRDSKVVVVGCGASFYYLDHLVRSGIGKLTIIDHDIVEETNVVRQGYFLSDINKPKVQAAKEHLNDISTGTEVTVVQGKFDELPTSEIDSIVEDADLLVFLTDSFACQAFGNKIAQQYNKKAIWAGYHNKSRSGEIIFHIPGITEACFRCAVSPRYKIQEERPIRFTSACNTIFHGAFLDSQVGFLTLALLMNETNGKEFSGWFKKGFKHNFIHLKTWPGTQSIFKALQGDNTTYYNFGSIWEEIHQETVFNGEEYNCPDCVKSI